MGVIQSIEILNKLNFIVSESAVQRGVKKVIKSTGLLGRWQKIDINPLIICDTGHNYAGITEVLKNIQLQKYQKLHIVLGFVKDKDVSNILKLLPQEATYYFCNAQISRALESKDLQSMAAEIQLQGTYYPSVADAFNQAKLNAEKADFIFIGGSTFIVADLLKYLKYKRING